MSGTTAYPLQPAYYAPNGIGQFKIGISPLGTRPSLNLWDTILSQYANSPTITQMLANMQQYLDPTGNIDDFYDDIWNIQTAQGYGLDVWGRIVGVNRILQVSNTAYFGFIGPSGESGLPFNQGVFYNGEPVTSNYALTDDAFRVLILTKALFNVCDGSAPAINQILLFLFGPSGPLPVMGNNYVVDGGNMTMQFTFGSLLTPLQNSIIYQSGVLPVPSGMIATVVVNNG
jgi:hypothetical protein